MNVENLLKVKALILEEPLRFDMGIWKTTDPDRLERDLPMPKCRTVACIAGWGATVFYLERNKRIKKIATAADQFESIDASDIAGGFFEIANGDDLFHESHWPDDLCGRLGDEKPGTLGYAQVAAEAIDRFIACDGNWANDQGPTTGAGA